MDERREKQTKEAQPKPVTPRGGPAAPPKKRKRRRLKRSVRRALGLVVAVAVLLSLSWLIAHWIDGPSEAALADSQSAPAAGAAADAPTDLGYRSAGPTPQDGAAMQLTVPDRAMIALPENGRIDMAYFDTTVFVGDSLTQGLFSFKSAGISNARYCTYVGVGPKQIYDGTMWENQDGVSEVPMDAIVAHQPDNVYVMLGTNAMVSISDDEILLAYYSEMLDVMKERLGPGVCIYVQSITPVLQGVDDRFDVSRIGGLNEALARMAFAKDLHFVDLDEVLAREDGWLRDEYGVTTDGYHLQPGGYRAWVEYLVTHTAYHSRHAGMYLEGSPYYRPLEA